LNLLLKNPYNMAIHGAGEVTADVSITSGWLPEQFSRYIRKRCL